MDQMNSDLGVINVEFEGNGFDKMSNHPPVQEEDAQRILNKKNSRIIKYIYKHPGVSEKKLQKLFGMPDHMTGWLLVMLIHVHYVSGKMPNGDNVSPYSTPLPSDAKFYTLPPGDKYVENMLIDNFREIRAWVTTAIAILAFFISLISISWQIYTWRQSSAELPQVKTEEAATTEADARASSRERVQTIHAM